MVGRKQAGDAWNEASRRLAKLLTEQRRAAGLSQEAVARRADLALSTVRKIEKNDIVEPGLFTVASLLRALNMHLSQLEVVLEQEGQGSSDDSG